MTTECKFLTKTQSLVTWPNSTAFVAKFANNKFDLKSHNFVTVLPNSRKTCRAREMKNVSLPQTQGYSSIRNFPQRNETCYIYY